jgi:hypothetical protein
MTTPASVAPSSVGVLEFELRRLREFSETEVQNLHAPVLGDEQVLWLQVAMHDSFFVRRPQSSRNLRPVITDPADRHRSSHDRFPQGLSFQ